jgi:uncharacterized protein (TIGR03437 family)
MSAARCLLSALAFAFIANAQPAIVDVVNSANRIPHAYPGHGIARGSLFSIVGQGLGPEERQQADFPLPSTDGLAGVKLQVTVNGVTASAILVFVSTKEVSAILPSSTPAGSGTVTLDNNGATATAPITVVERAFGIFSIDFYSGLQQAVAFNVKDDGSVQANDIVHPAAAGQTITIIGTGLGAIPSDETQPGPTDVPEGINLKIFVGTREATLVSAGRGTCCDPMPPGFPVRPGTAAIDLVQFTVPEGISGCHVTLAIQSGDAVSNLAQIAIASPGSDSCQDINAVDFGDFVTLSGTVKTGNISLLRTVNRSSSQLGSVEIGTEVGTALFYKFDVPENSVPIPVSSFGILANNLNPGSCVQGLSRVPFPPSPLDPSDPPPPAVNPPVPLDAGAQLNVKAGSTTKVLRKGRDGVYSGALGSTFVTPGLPLLSSGFLEPGTFTVDNDSGGTDIPAFNVNITLPKPALVFENIAELETVNRSQGVTVKWSGGDPDGFVTIIGTSSASDGTSALLISNFACTERISAKEFTVPAFVTLGIVPTTNIGQLPAAGLGTIGLQSYVAKRVDIPTIELTILSSTVLLSRSTVYR